METDQIVVYLDLNVLFTPTENIEQHCNIYYFMLSIFLQLEKYFVSFLKKVKFLLLNNAELCYHYLEK